MPSASLIRGPTVPSKLPTSGTVVAAMIFSASATTTGVATESWK
jgi:hypothetical protein